MNLNFEKGAKSTLNKFTRRIFTVEVNDSWRY